jgi:hypothetical protein
MLFLYMRRLARYRRGTIIHVLFSIDFTALSRTSDKPRNIPYGQKQDPVNGVVNVVVI